MRAEEPKHHLRTGVVVKALTGLGLEGKQAQKLLE